MLRVSSVTSADKMQPCSSLGECQIGSKQAEAAMKLACAAAVAQPNSLLCLPDLSECLHKGTFACA